MKTKFFDAQLSAPLQEGGAGTVKTPALLFVEGEQTTSDGVETTETVEDLERYTKASNAWIESGRSVSFFLNPHGEGGGYSVKDQIGHFSSFEARIIEEKDVNEDAFEDLIGKFGVFAIATITDPVGIEKYNNGNLREISVGIADLEEGQGEQFFEVSAVPIGAVRGAKLYGIARPAPKGKVKKKKSKKRKDSRKLYALTLGGAIAESNAPYSAVQDEVSDLAWMVSRIVQNINAATPEELADRDRQTLLSDVVEDFAVRLRQVLSLPSVPPIPTGATFKMKFQGRKFSAVITDLKAGDEQATTAIAAIASELGVTADDLKQSLQPETAEQVALYSRVTSAIASKIKAPVSPMPDDQTAKRFAAIESKLNTAMLQLEQEQKTNAELKKRTQIAATYSALKSQAAQLNADGKLSAHAYSTYFPNETQEQAVDRFMGELPEDAPSLEAIGATLGHIKQFGVAVKTRSVSGAEQISTDKTQAESDLDRYCKKYGITGEQKQAYMNSLKAKVA